LISRLLSLAASSSLPACEYIRAEVACHTEANHEPPRFINNEWVEGVDKKTFEVINPATEEVICSVHEATEKDVDLAVSAARKAFEGSWRQTTPQQRGMLMLKLAELAEQNKELLAAVESLDNGKSISMARGDVGAVIGCIRYYGGWADKIEGKTIDIAPDMFHYTRQEPVSLIHLHALLE
jgi:aldehyde dehydrogenase (NAD+)